MSEPKVVGTHFVVKIEDMQNYLPEEEATVLVMLLGRVEKGRVNDFKKLNSHYICNTDEPYAEDVLEVILRGEKAKEEDTEW